MFAVSGALTLRTAYLGRRRCVCIGAGGPLPDRKLFGRADGTEESATVIILPVVRIERHDERYAEDAEPYSPPPAENGGRRRMRRR